MPLESDAEHVVYLTLHVLCARVYIGDRRERRIVFGHLDTGADSMRGTGSPAVSDKHRHHFKAFGNNACGEARAGGVG